MNSTTRQKLSALWSLVNHPKTPENERENARARIAEIDERVRSEEAKSRTQVRSAMPTAMGDMAARISRQGLASFKRRARAYKVEDEETVHDRWPFGWTGPRDSLRADEFELGYGRGGSCVLGWKCPDCGDHVTRVIDARMMLRFEAKPNAFKEYTDRIISGETNHLCANCWRKWNEA